MRKAFDSREGNISLKNKTSSVCYLAWIYTASREKLMTEYSSGSVKVTAHNYKYRLKVYSTIRTIISKVVSYSQDHT